MRHNSAISPGVGYSSLFVVKLIYLIVATLLSVWTMIAGSLVAGVFLAYLACIALRFVIILLTREKRDFAFVYTWTYVDASLILWPCLAPLIKVGVADTMHYGIYFGLALLLFAALMALIFHGKLPCHSPNLDPWVSLKRPIVILLMVLFFFVAFLFSFLSDYYGIAHLGRHRAKLPFQVAGILEHTRLLLVPIFGIVLLDIMYRKGLKALLVLFCVLFFVWTLYEGTIRLSKSAFVAFPIFIGTWLIFINALRLRHFLVFAVLLVFALYTYAPIMYLRTSIEEISVRTLFDLTRELNYDVREPIHSGFTRMFLAGDHMERIVVNFDTELFSGRAFDAWRTWRSTARVMTHEVDGFPIGIPHSSGATMVTEGFLVGGLIPALVISFSVLFLAVAIDSWRFGIAAIVLHLIFFRLLVAGLNAGMIETYLSRGKVTIVYLGILMMLIWFIRKRLSRLRV